MLKLKLGPHLRRILYANAAICAVIGLLLAIAPGAVSDFADVDWDSSLRVIGVIALAWAGFVVYVARTLVHRLGWVVFWGDCAWFLGSYLLLALGALEVSTDAKWAFAFVADVALLFAVLEFCALRCKHV